MAEDGLDRAQIVRAAIELLDADGVNGLSMRRLGKQLDSGATSVYWHVGNKYNLVGLAADTVFDEVGLPDPATVGWQEALGASSHGLRATIGRHPWLVPVLGAHPEIHGPHIARYQNHSLTACEIAGFTGHDLDWASSTVFTFVIGAVWGEASSTLAGLSKSTVDVADVVERARTSAQEYPKLLQRYDALAAADVAQVSEESFAFGLRVVLDGLAARLAAATPG